MRVQGLSAQVGAADGEGYERWGGGNGHGFAEETGAEGEDTGVVPSGGDEGYAEAGAERVATGGHGEAAQIEEVHEVVVAPEIRVEADRIGGELGHRVNRAGGGSDERADGGEDGVGCATELGEAVGGAEAVDGGRGFAAEDDLGDGVIETGGAVDYIGKRTTGRSSGLHGC